MFKAYNQFAGIFNQIAFGCDSFDVQNIKGSFSKTIKIFNVDAYFLSKILLFK